MNLLQSASRAFVYAVSGRLRFRRTDLGRTLEFGDDSWRIFRQVEVGPEQEQASGAEAVFLARFRLAGMSPALNIPFSLLPMPFFLGLPGLRTKTWLINERTGEFAGLYLWRTFEDARSYAESYAARFMCRRAVSGSTVFQIYPAGHPVAVRLLEGTGQAVQTQTGRRHSPRRYSQKVLAE